MARDLASIWADRLGVRKDSLIPVSLKVTPENRLQYMGINLILDCIMQETINIYE